MAQSRRWCFTINNPSLEDREFLNNSLSDCQYAVVGREEGESGTPHLQGFVIWKRNKRFNACKAAIGQRAHLEAARGTSEEAANYCKKDGNYEEWGSLPSEQGKRSDLERFRQWITDHPTKPTERDIAAEWPAIFLRYRQHATAMVDLLYPSPVLVRGELRQWQRDLDELLQGEPDDRRINFVCDPVGGKGKSWFIRYYVSNHPESTQRLSVGKRDDLCFALDVTKKIFLFDIPRGQLEFLQYSVLESIKDQMIFSPKYQSMCKVLPNPVHVVVFTNEDPDRNKFTADRYNIIHLI